jgi:ribosomal protein L31
MVVAAVGGNNLDYNELDRLKKSVGDAKNSLIAAKIQAKNAALDKAEAVFQKAEAAFSEKKKEMAKKIPLPAEVKHLSSLDWCSAKAEERRDVIKNLSVHPSGECRDPQMYGMLNELQAMADEVFGMDDSVKDAIKTHDAAVDCLRAFYLKQKAQEEEAKEQEKSKKKKAAEAVSKSKTKSLNDLSRSSQSSQGPHDSTKNAKEKIEEAAKGGSTKKLSADPIANNIDSATHTAFTDGASVQDAEKQSRSSQQKKRPYGSMKKVGKNDDPDDSESNELVKKVRTGGAGKAAKNSAMRAAPKFISELSPSLGEEEDLVQLEKEALEVLASGFKEGALIPEALKLPTSLIDPMQLLLSGKRPHDFTEGVKSNAGNASECGSIQKLSADPMADNIDSATHIAFTDDASVQDAEKQPQLSQHDSEFNELGEIVKETKKKTKRKPLTDEQRARKNEKRKPLTDEQRARKNEKRKPLTDEQKARKNEKRKPLTDEQKARKNEKRRNNTPEQRARQNEQNRKYRQKQKAIKLSMKK